MEACLQEQEAREQVGQGAATSEPVAHTTEPSASRPDAAVAGLRLVGAGSVPDYDTLA